MQGHLTIAVPFSGAHVSAVDAMLDMYGNPARGDIERALAACGFVHFVSINVIHDAGDARAHLVIDAAVDGAERGALRALAEPGALRPFLVQLLRAADVDFGTGSLADYLERYRLCVGAGWGSTLGVTFCGTPGMSVGRIRREAHLAEWMSEWLARTPLRGTALRTLERLRNEAFRRIDLKWAFVAEPVPLLAPAPAIGDAVLPMVGSIFRQMAWPIAVPPLLAALSSWLWFKRAPDQVVWDTVLFFGVELLLCGALFWLVYRSLRREELADVAPDAPPRPLAEMAPILAREDRTMQNHLAGVSQIKPGWPRRVVLRFIMWLVGALAQYAARPGYLCDIGSIHFARWVALPGTKKLLFFSNYDLSWGSYLEDFIARAKEGLSAIWSNTEGFPKTANLVAGGAGDGERFKRWARRQQRITRFWYTAYPDLTASRIRINAELRHGFAGATTEGEAARVLALLHQRAPHTVDETEAAPLALGGLGQFQFSHCLLVKLSGPPAARWDWLNALQPDLTYADEVDGPFARLLALSACGLEALGLDAQSRATFPIAFQQGMAARLRTLGDDNAEDHPDRWWWGANGREVDAALILYARQDDLLNVEIARRSADVFRHGHRVVHEVAMAALPLDKRLPLREPFGFIDGISQPLVRGTPEAAGADPHHVIEPGELVLGYKDNLGYVAPTPRANGRDLGSNGTFLVIRQLEQDTVAYEQYLTQAARELGGQPGVPRAHAHAREWVAAKMTGRWRTDGSSVVRYPDAPASQAGVAVREAADNAFLFGKEDPEGLGCPFGAHIRRANPRDSLDPGSPVQIAITNRHRILRVGRPYGPQNGSDRMGLFFMCVNADIERQFEFLQQTWMLGRTFHGLEDELDPVVGHRRRANAPETLTIPTPAGQIRLPRMRHFVRVRGGGYFFLPGRSAMNLILDETRPPPRQPLPTRISPPGPYSAPWWLPGGHLQTWYGAGIRTPLPDYRRERWNTPDGDFIDVDWTGAPDAPHLLVLFHGLEGCSGSEYARAIGACAVASGWGFAVPHFRGCSGEPNRTPRAYHAGDSEEIDWILRRFANRPTSVHAAGVSLGANALLKWLGLQGEAASDVVRRAVAISAPFRLAASSRTLQKGIRVFYGKHFLEHNLRAKALLIEENWPGHLDVQKVREASNLAQFEDAATAPLHGFADKEDYYRRASAEPHLPAIRVPTLLLNARNDPFLPEDVLRDVEQLRARGVLPAELVLEFPHEGGHGGFPSTDEWLGRRVLSFLTA